METIKDIFALIGGGTIVTVVAFAFIDLKDAIGDWISEKKYEHRYKHRFDKSPTAECYCRDCARWGTSLCFFNYKTPDNYFCCRATHITAKQDKLREEQEEK